MTKQFPENQDQWPQNGSWKAIHGKLAIDDSRAAYVVGTANGHTGPWASFWDYSEAIRYAKRMNA